MSTGSSVDENSEVKRLFSHLQPRLALVCSDNVLRDVAYHVQFSESELGTRLNLCSSDVANIDQRETGYEKKYQVFITWKRRFGNRSTYSALIKALARCRPFDMHILECVKSAVEADSPSTAVAEDDSQRCTQLAASSPCSMASAGGAMGLLVTSIASQLCMNGLLLSKEKECQALQEDKKRYEETVHQLQMVNTALLEKIGVLSVNMEKQDSQSRETIHQLQVENKYLRDRLELSSQILTPLSICASLCTPTQPDTRPISEESTADFVVPKSEGDFITFDDAEESLGEPHLKEDSLYFSSADQQYSEIMLATDHGGHELDSNEHSLTFGDAFVAIDESAMMEWPSQPNRKRSLSPDTSPNPAKMLLI